jgi:O-succinylbenzoate synthase
VSREEESERESSCAVIVRETEVQIAWDESLRENSMIIISHHSNNNNTTIINIININNNNSSSSSSRIVMLVSRNIAVVER